MTPSRQEIDHHTSSSSSSTSPPMTSSTVSSESVARQERGDPCGIDHYPVTVLGKHVERQERERDLCSSGIPRRAAVDWANQKSKNQIKMRVTIENGETRAIPTYRNGCKNSKRILRVTQFLNAELHTPILLMNHLQSLRLREVRIWVKHSVHTHFPKDRNCEICQRTKITRAPCRRLIGGVVPRAELGDLITADHKVLSEGCAVVVQDLATQWIQWYPCKTKTSQETQRSLQKFLEPDGKLRVIYTDNSLEFGKACEDLSWNHCTSTPHRSETNGIAERAVRRVKEGTSAVLWQSFLDEKWWADSMKCLYPSAKRHRFIIWWEDAPMKDVLGNHLMDRLFHLGHWLSITRKTPKDQSQIHQFGKKVLPGLFPWIRSVRGENLEGWHNGCRHWGVGNDGRIGNLLEKTQCERGDISQTRRIYFFQSQMDESNFLEEIKTWEHPP